jgi:hypothetical protein
VCAQTGEERPSQQREENLPRHVASSSRACGRTDGRTDGRHNRPPALSADERAPIEAQHKHMPCQRPQSTYVRLKTLTLLTYPSVAEASLCSVYMNHCSRRSTLLSNFPSSRRQRWRQRRSPASLPPPPPFSFGSSQSVCCAKRDWTAKDNVRRKKKRSEKYRRPKRSTHFSSFLSWQHRASSHLVEDVADCCRDRNRSLLILFPLPQPFYNNFHISPPTPPPSKP